MNICHNCGSSASRKYEDGRYYCSTSCFDESHRREANTLIGDRTQAQAARIKELENALEAYEKEHATNAHEEGVDAGMSFPPDNCDCDLCRTARRVLQVKE